MNLSTYCLIFPSEGRRNSFLIYSTKNAAIAEVPAAVLRRIQKGEHIPEKDARLLRRHGIIVADPEREKKLMLRRIDSLNRASRFMSIKLVMNLDCNLNCRYCFEGNRKGKFYMTNETADQFVEFVRKKLDHPQPNIRHSSLRGQRSDCPTLEKGGEGGFYEELFITFYGGEPLLSRQLIVYVANKLKNLTKNRGVSFSFALQTNGTLLTKEIVHNLKTLGLTEVYVTVDGPKVNHDLFRPYKSGRGSFDAILKNMQDVCELVDLHPGGNFTRDNYGQFPMLLDLYAAYGLTPDKLASVSFYPVVSETSDVLPDFNEGCASINEPWVIRAGLMLREEILRRGYRTARLLPVVCMMEHDNNMLVNYNGDIYKCPGLIGRKGFCAGSIRSGIGDYRASHNICNWKNEECLDCAYLPLCFGGCRYMKYVRDANMNGVNCKKQYLDTALATMVRQDMRYTLH